MLPDTGGVGYSGYRTVQEGSTMMFARALCLAVSGLAVSVPAFADSANGDACSKTLAPPALEIYRAAAPDMRPDTDMSRLLRSKIMPMVVMGDMNQSTARPAAMAASTCLRALAEPAHDAKILTVSAAK
jgi:hypothetical protein